MADKNDGSGWKEQTGLADERTFARISPTEDQKNYVEKRVVTFATLGYGDSQPIGAWARLLAGAETILGTLLSALLVFVLARIVTW